MLKLYNINHTLLAKTVLMAAAVSLFSTSYAKEGMWIPATIKDREADMKTMGLQIPVEKLYNDNGTGMNNAVVLFGKGCTGELISGKGLLLTNHHCGYGGHRDVQEGLRAVVGGGLRRARTALSR